MCVGLVRVHIYRLVGVQLTLSSHGFGQKHGFDQKRGFDHCYITMPTPNNAPAPRRL